MTYLTVEPAYGRDYRNKKSALSDWESGKDFRIVSVGPDMGRYINKSDATGVHVIIRYFSARRTVRAQ